ncbi:MAG: MucB/RseB C-terminal domain-containing protein [Gammaproteobacteria bacterium]
MLTARLTKRGGVALACTAVLLCSIPAWAAPTNAAGWLAYMQKALSHESYRGILVFMGKNRSATYQLVVSAGKYARMSALTGPSREIVRGPRVVVRLGPGGSTMVVRGMGGGASPLPFPPATQVKVSVLEKNYALELGGSDRVAGKSAQLMRIVPRDKWRYGYRVWISSNSGLPLRSELMTASGEILQQAFFTRMSLVSAPAAQSAIGAKAMSLLAHAEDKGRTSAGPCLGTNAPQLTFRHLPPGFHVEKTVCERSPGGGLPVTHMLIGDGLATVSLFVAAHQAGGPALVGATAFGSVHAVGRLVGSYALTAMGDAPINTVAHIARDLKVGDK